MKKTIAVIAAISMLFSFCACGSSSNKTPGDDTPEVTVTPKEKKKKNTPIPEITPEEITKIPGEVTKVPTPTETPAPTEEVLPTVEPKQSGSKAEELRTDVTIEKTVLYDKDGVKITATGLEFTATTVDVILQIENNSDTTQYILSGDSGFDCNSVNNYMMDGADFFCGVNTGETEEGRMSYDKIAFELCGITEITEFATCFDICNEDMDHVYTDPLILKTSLYDQAEGDGSFFDAIIDEKTKNDFAYSVEYASKDMLYNASGVKIVSDVILKNQRGSSSLILELENTTNEQVNAIVGYFSLNGLRINDSD